MGDGSQCHEHRNRQKYVELCGVELRTQVSTVSDHFAVDLRHDADGFLYGSDVGLQVRFDLQLGLSIAEWNSIKRTLVWPGERTQSEFPVQNSTHHCLRLFFTWVCPTTIYLFIS